MTSGRVVRAGGLALLAVSLTNCAGRSSPISPRAVPPGLEGRSASSGQFYAGLRTGGYSPPLTLERAQQILAQQGRAGNPNYNVVDGHGNYVYSVSDH